MNRDSVYDAINSERDFQETFIAEKGLKSEKTVGEYLTLIRTYCSRADIAWTFKSGDDSALNEIRKIAAICVACMERHGVKSRENLSTAQPVITPKKTNIVSKIWQKISSTNINEIQYDRASYTLSIRFKHGGEYIFYNVPSYIYDGMLKAPSKGQYFHRNIRGVFKSDKVL